MNTTETNTNVTFEDTSDLTAYVPITTTTSFPFTGTSFYPNGTTVSSAMNWGYPKQLEVNEVGESIEIIYKETSNMYRTGGLPPYNDTRIFKIVYSCVDGKWNKSEPIYGKIVPAQEEYYDFDL
jgi:hypothetical protein